jgi:hypothetical protein
VDPFASRPVDGTTSLNLKIQFHESNAWAVTETTVRSLRAALECAMDRLHGDVEAGPTAL